jgi:hypothetical protein
LRLSNLDELATLSDDFIAAYQQPGGASWSGFEDVEVMTLDGLIEQFGLPAFCKLDIEGWEPEALRGLSRPLAALSFEYLVRLRSKALTCIKRLDQLGPFEFNFSPYEDFRFMLNAWLDAREFDAWISSLPAAIQCGDIYARTLKSTNATGPRRGGRSTGAARASGPTDREIPGS